MTTENISYFQEALGEIASILEEIRASKTNQTKSSFLTVEESARHLNVSTDLIRKWVFQKKINSYRIGKCVRLKRSDLDNCIN